MICLSSESYDDTVWLLRQTSKDINNIAMYSYYYSTSPDYVYVAIVCHCYSY